MRGSQRPRDCVRRSGDGWHALLPRFSPLVLLMPMQYPPRTVVRWYRYRRTDSCTETTRSQSGGGFDIIRVPQLASRSTFACLLSSRRRVVSRALDANGKPVGSSCVYCANVKHWFFSPAPKCVFSSYRDPDKFVVPGSLSLSLSLSLIKQRCGVFPRYIPWSSSDSHRGLSKKRSRPSQRESARSVRGRRRDKSRAKTTRLATGVMKLLLMLLLAMLRLVFISPHAENFIFHARARAPEREVFLPIGDSFELEWLEVLESVTSSFH